MRIALTGSHGFIGTRFRELFSNIVEIYCFDIKKGCDVSELSSLDRNDISECDIIINLAALTDAGDSVNEPAKYWNNNVGILNQLMKSGQKPIVHASSCAVDEPLNPYALTKCVNEKQLQSYKPPSVAVRFYNVYGPGTDKGVIPEFARRIKNGQDLIVYGDCVRSFVHVDSVCFKLFDVAKRILDGRYDYQLDYISGHAIQIKNLAQLMIGFSDFDSNSGIVHEQARVFDPVISYGKLGEKDPNFEYKLNKTMEEIMK